MEIEIEMVVLLFAVEVNPEETAYGEFLGGLKREELEFLHLHRQSDLENSERG
jgi:hypothetical protein